MTVVSRVLSGQDARRSSTSSTTRTDVAPSGTHNAKEITFTGRVFGTSEAFALGMVNAVVPTDQLDVVTREVVDAIAAGPPLALSPGKRELDNAAHTSLAQALETEALAQSVNAQTDDLREALMAYVERRPSNFSGR